MPHKSQAMQPARKPSITNSCSQRLHFRSRYSSLYIKRRTGEIVTLSHCWCSGSIQPQTTTKDTLEDRISLVEFDASSKTFAQAVEITRSLGVRYLWIDSLCIIQDSQEDWARESEKMGDIYHSATLTLSAASAQNTTQGLFPDPNERRSLQTVFELSCPGLSGTTSLIVVRPRHHDPSNPWKLSHASTTCGKSKLSTRGWVIQESTYPRV
jgi:hypothetical protein